MIALLLSEQLAKSTPDPKPRKHQDTEEGQEHNVAHTPTVKGGCLGTNEFYVGNGCAATLDRLD